jgi:hypothetical protein
VGVSANYQPGRIPVSIAPNFLASLQYCDTIRIGLQCPPNEIVVKNNRQLTSLAGLDGLSPSTNLTKVTIAFNDKLTTAGAFAPLIRVLGCVGSGAGATGAAQIRFVDVQVLESSK